jgi:hypothetical protein
MRKSRRSDVRRLALIALVAGCATGEPPGGPGLPGGPLAPPRGRPGSQQVVQTIGSAGGSLQLATADGAMLLVAVPPGAVSAPTDFSIEDLAISGLDGAVGGGYRIGPAGAVLSVAATLTFTPPGSQNAADLTAAYQGATGYWSRVYSIVRGAGTLSATTAQLGDWSLVTLATQRDLHGTFRLDSNQGLPFTATGNVTLQFLAEAGSLLLYMPEGEITLATPVATGGVTCTPNGAATAALPASIAEIRSSPLRFYWGINGEWSLTCSDGTRSFVSTNFDSMGITNLECARGYSSAWPLQIGAAHVQGQLVVDCGAGGEVVASWDLVPPDGTPAPLPGP